MPDAADMEAYRKVLRPVRSEPPLKDGDGGGISGGMDGRVSALEAHMEHVREDTREIKALLGSISDKLATMPTKADLSSWKLQWTGLAIAAIAIVVGGIIGGLAWIQPEQAPPPAPQPIVVTIPK